MEKIENKNQVAGLDVIDSAKLISTIIGVNQNYTEQIEKVLHENNINIKEILKLEMYKSNMSFKEMLNKLSTLNKKTVMYGADYAIYISILSVRMFADEDMVAINYNPAKQDNFRISRTYSNILKIRVKIKTNKMIITKLYTLDLNKGEDTFKVSHMETWDMTHDKLILNADDNRYIRYGMNNYIFIPAHHDKFITCKYFKGDETYIISNALGQPLLVKKIKNKTEPLINLNDEKEFQGYEEQVKSNVTSISTKIKELNKMMAHLCNNHTDISLEQINKTINDLKLIKGNLEGIIELSHKQEQQ